MVITSITNENGNTIQKNEVKERRNLYLTKDTNGINSFYDNSNTYLWTFNNDYIENDEVITSGTYCYYHSNTYYVSRVICEDTVHQIEDKYISETFATKEYVDNQRLGWEDTVEFSIPIDGSKVESPVTLDEVIGLKVKTEVNAYRLNTTLVRPENEEDRTSSSVLECPFNDSDSTRYVLFGYHNGNVLDKKVLFIELLPKDSDSVNIKKVKYSMCTAFTEVYSGYDCAAYFYEQTSDTLGMGITIESGWYAVNSTTYNYVPFDIEKYPIRIFDDMFDNSEVFVDDYFYQITKHNEIETFTIASENIFEVGCCISYVPFSVLEYYANLSTLSYVQFLNRYLVFMISDGMISYGNGSACGKTVNILYIKKGIHQIEDKYIPDNVKNYYLDLSDISTTINDFCNSESIDTILEYTLSQDIYDKTVEAIKNKTFSGVIHLDNSGEQCVYPLICYYELVDAIMFGMHIGKNNCVSKIAIMISRPEQKCVRIARMIDNNLPFIDLSETDCTNTFFFELTEEQNRILDYYAISKQPIICAIKLDGSYTSYVTLNYSETESYRQFIGSFNKRIIALNYEPENSSWNGIIVDDGYIRIMTELNSNNELTQLSDEDFFRIILGVEANCGSSINIEFKENGIFHCVSLNLVTSNSFLAYADTNTRRWYFFEKDDGFYAMSELLELPIKEINITTQPVLNSVVALSADDNDLMNNVFIVDYLFTTNCRCYFSVGCINTSEAIMSVKDNIRYFTFVDRDRIVSIYGDVSNTTNTVQWYIEEKRIAYVVDKYFDLPSNFISGENLTIESNYNTLKILFDKIVSGEIVGLKFTNTEYSATYNFISHIEGKITDDSGMVEYELCAYGYDVNSNKYFEFIITYAEDSTLNIGEININYIE